jgi:RimJ/RimL family protein N-acetyltransferase
VIWTFNYPLRTERLTLRAHQLTDLEDLLVFHSDPEVTRYIPWPVRDRQQTLDALVVKLTQTVACEPGEWIVLAIEENSSHTVIGEILLKRKSDVRAELGYVLAREAQGKGYVTEAAAHLLTFGVTTVDATVEEPNTASVRVLTRLGFAPTEPTESAEPGILSFTLHTHASPESLTP